MRLPVGEHPFPDAREGRQLVLTSDHRHIRPDPLHPAPADNLPPGPAAPPALPAEQWVAGPRPPPHFYRIGAPGARGTPARVQKNPRAPPPLLAGRLFLKPKLELHAATAAVL